MLICIALIFWQLHDCYTPEILLALDLRRLELKPRECLLKKKKKPLKDLSLAIGAGVRACLWTIHTKCEEKWISLLCHSSWNSSSLYWSLRMYSPTEERRAAWLFFLDVLLCLGCHNKILLTGSLKQQRFLSLMLGHVTQLWPVSYERTSGKYVPSW